MTDVTPKSIASSLDITPKALRRFMRSHAKANAKAVQPVGQGNRYALSASDAKAIVNAYRKAHASKAPVHASAVVALALEGEANKA